MTINRSKRTLRTSKIIHSGSASVAHIKSYQTSKVKGLESKASHLKIKGRNHGSLAKKGVLSKSWASRTMFQLNVPVEYAQGLEVPLLTDEEEKLLTSEYVLAVRWISPTIRGQCEETLGGGLSIWTRRLQVLEEM